MRTPAVLAAAVLLLVAGCDSTTPSFPVPVSEEVVGFLTPVPGAVLTQGFGCTSFALEPLVPGCPGRHFHSGIDLAKPAGTPVLAAAGGLVTVARFDPNGYGNYLVLDAGHGLTTLYAHLQEFDVQLGEPVFKGYPIARVGSTGMSTGPHLHFEVRTDGRRVDPELFLPAAHQRGGSP